MALVAAVAANGVIGRDGRLPWKIPVDMRRFKALTMGKPVIMGRKTFASIGKPLPGRENIVVTRDPAWSAEGVRVALSFLEAVDIAVHVARATGADEVMAIGGAQIYAEALPLARRLHLTEVAGEVAGDTFFPPVDARHWREVERIHPLKEDAATHDCSFVTLERHG
ncbi:MAG: dihydrofolate reductase [Alphaproteobacteria bacterium]|nr:dihydrofolate reductase [Alphaproteobacteria bacterium]